MPEKISAGQRWISENEPELGLGVVKEAEGRNVRMEFPAVSEMRIYSRENAPLKRFLLEEGDEATSRGGLHFHIEGVQQQNGILFYLGSDNRVIPETELKDDLNARHEELLHRLLAGQFGRQGEFSLRRRAQEFRTSHLASPSFGFSGPRIGLIAHQYSIALRASSGTKLPRLLLSDEVGLGKTIEAALIHHRLKLAGKVQRVLVITPPSLKYQWMVELYRRFNSLFTLIEEESFAEENPFLQKQEIICGLDTLLADPARIELAKAAGWDLLIVDEAHHLRRDGPAYSAVKILAKASPGLLLLTATPQQVDPADHFARLQLLDPVRYLDYRLWSAAVRNYRGLAEGLHSWLKNAKEPLPESLQKVPEILAFLSSEYEKSTPLDQARVLADLFGPGYQQIRNTRATVGGFPRRIVLPHSLEALTGKDERILWLETLLKNTSKEKFLCICARKEEAVSFSEALRKRIDVDMVLFHEDLPLVARDRAAAWFADPEGARVLIASEIGSEGRNFQHASHLVLLDLPPEPGLLEQRIGRLDRIGQEKDVKIHIPFIKGGKGERLFRWYNEGLDCFSRPMLGGVALLREFREELDEFLDGSPDEFLEEVRESAEYLRGKVEEGRDKLQEMVSSDSTAVVPVLESIEQEETDTRMEEFLSKVWDHFGVEVETGPWKRSLVIRPGDHMSLDAFPGLSEDGLTLSRDRNQALAREDIQLLTWDHPVAQGALDALLNGQDGRVSCFEWENAPTEGLILFGFLLEYQAPVRLGISELIPPRLLQACFDGDGFAFDEEIPHSALKRELPPGKMSVENIDLEKLEDLLKKGRQKVLVEVERERNETLDLLDRQAVQKNNRLGILEKASPQLVAKRKKQNRDDLARMRKALETPQIQLDSICVIQPCGK